MAILSYQLFSGAGGKVTVSLSYNDRNMRIVGAEAVNQTSAPAVFTFSQDGKAPERLELPAGQTLSLTLQGRYQYTMIEGQPDWGVVDISVQYWAGEPWL